MPKDRKQDKMPVADRSEAEQSAAAAIPRLTLKQLREAIDQVPVINATRVVQLHQRIMASEYKINLDSLTDKLLALENELSHD